MDASGDDPTGGFGQSGFCHFLCGSGKGGNSYTWETLELLRDKEPETEFFFIEGADSLFAMESWKNPEIIFRDCTILAAVRDGKGDDDLREQIDRLEKSMGPGSG